MAVSPEEIGLCGCWQVLAVERQTLPVNGASSTPTVEIGYYVTSLSHSQCDDPTLLAIVRGHWSAIENGTHYRRDVTLGEDANRTAHRVGAEVLASLRNLTNGLYELQKVQERTKAKTLSSWCKQQTFSTAWKLMVR